MAITKTRPGFLTREYGQRVVRFYAGKVVKGVKLLEKEVPTWKNKVALSNLDLASGSYCVLGQAIAKSAFMAAGFVIEARSPDYGTAVEELGINGPDYGFDLHDEVGYYSESIDSSQEYEILNHLWTEAIRLVRAGEKVTIGALLGRV